MADIYGGHQQSSNCNVNCRNPCQLKLTSQLISAERLSSFTRAISSLASKTVDNSRVTGRPQQFWLALKSPWFPCFGCLPQPQPSVPVLLQAGCGVGDLHSVLQRLCTLSIPAARLKSSDSSSASPSTPFTSSRPADLFMLHTAVQWMHKSPTCTCVCTGTVECCSGSTTELKYVNFYCQEFSFYKLVCFCCLVTHLAAPV